MKNEPTMQQNNSNGENHTAKTVISYLEANANQLDKQTVVKLDHARERAISALVARKHGVAATGTNGTQVLSVLGDFIGHHRPLMFAALVLGSVLIALLLSQKFTAQNETEQGDAFLLASDLPPEAYLDKGFDVWLKRK